MKILVTGANGYLGQGVVRSILDNGHEVIATDFRMESVDDRANKIKCDLFEIEDPYTFFGKPDVLLHLAWRDGFIHNSKSHIIDLPKHFNFIESMMISGIKRVVVMGSMHEVGFYEGSIDENTPCKPMNLYGIGKNALRHAVDMFSKQNNVQYQWLRGYYIVGNSKYGNSIFSKITSEESGGKKEFPFTTGQSQFDFVDYNEFCMQVAAVVGQDQVVGIINIGSGCPERLADRVERFIKENNYKIKLKYGCFPERPYDSKAIWGDHTKIEAILNNKNYLYKNKNR